MVYLDLLIYFIAGVIQDFLFTTNAKFIIEKKVFSTAIFAFLTTLISMAVLYNILTKLNEQRSIIAIVVYALGIGVGTILAMKLKIRKIRAYSSVG